MCVILQNIIKLGQRFFTTQHNAKHGIYHSRVSVCVSVCHTPVLYHKKLCYCRGTVNTSVCTNPATTKHPI